MNGKSSNGYIKKSGWEIQVFRFPFCSIYSVRVIHFWYTFLSQRVTTHGLDVSFQISSSNNYPTNGCNDIYPWIVKVSSHPIAAAQSGLPTCLIHTELIMTGWYSIWLAVFHVWPGRDNTTIYSIFRVVRHPVSLNDHWYMTFHDYLEVIVGSSIKKRPLSL